VRALALGGGRTTPMATTPMGVVEPTPWPKWGWPPLFFSFSYFFFKKKKFLLFLIF
jgi:hypothetical protein